MSRFVDREDLGELHRRSTDFVIRHHGSFILWLTYAFVISVVALVIFIIHSLQQTLLTPFKEYVTIADVLSGVFFAILVMVVLAVYVYLVVGKIRTIVSKTEFLSALLSGAARSGAHFCLIIGQEKEVVYADSAASRLFGKPTHGLEQLVDLLAYDGFNEDERDKIENAVVKGKKLSMPFKYITASGKESAIELRMEPIDRPKGFVVLRGFDKKKGK